MNCYRHPQFLKILHNFPSPIRSLVYLSLFSPSWIPLLHSFTIYFLYALYFNTFVLIHHKPWKFFFRFHIWHFNILFPHFLSDSLKSLLSFYALFWPLIHRYIKQPRYLNTHPHLKPYFASKYSSVPLHALKHAPPPSLKLFIQFFHSVVRSFLYLFIYETLFLFNSLLFYYYSHLCLFN